MFTPKANSKQKRVKKTQEHETGHAVREILAPASAFTRPGECIHSPWRVITDSSRKNSIFHPKISILTSLCPNLIPKFV
ncbi:hypothetical protein MTR_7g446300 [Medicago truncatula]|uniref:Uncharacterized protein n=1 Tax=Medicago truncatula TaxID=3880 RepID=A0A072TYB1_MEDTR|nr:hypothetical protein MTR_7g446300 [Medicago truncatula]